MNREYLLDLGFNESLKSLKEYKDRIISHLEEDDTIIGILKYELISDYEPHEIFYLLTIFQEEVLLSHVGFIHYHFDGHDTKVKELCSLPYKNIYEQQVSPKGSVNIIGIYTNEEKIKSLSPELTEKVLNKSRVKSARK